MLIKEPLDFAKEFIKSVNQCIEKEKPGRRMSRHQQWWLAFCITSVVLTNSVCWAHFERISLGRLTLKSISWMFRRSKILWEQLLVCSVRVVLKTYGITEGVLVLDDSDRARSKNTKNLHKVHKLKDKKTNGYAMGQNLVFMILVTPKITIPVGFAFYEPEPAKKAWKLKNKRLKQQGIAKKDRPQEPEKNPQYPTKQELALKLLKDFAISFHEMEVMRLLNPEKDLDSHVLLQQHNETLGGEIKRNKPFSSESLYAFSKLLAVRTLTSVNDIWGYLLHNLSKYPQIYPNIVWAIGGTY